MFLYIGLAADPDFIQKLFGVSTPAQINVEAPTLEAFDNPISERVRRVIDTVRYTHFFFKFRPSDCSLMLFGYK